MEIPKEKNFNTPINLLVSQKVVKRKRKRETPEKKLNARCH